MGLEGIAEIIGERTTLEEGKMDRLYGFIVSAVIARKSSNRLVAEFEGQKGICYNASVGIAALISNITTIFFICEFLRMIPTLMRYVIDPVMGIFFEGKCVKRIRPLMMGDIVARTTEMALRREKILTLLVGGMMHALIAYEYREKFPWTWRDAFDKDILYTGNALAACGCFKEMYDELFKYEPDLSYECPDDSDGEESDNDSCMDVDNVVPDNSDAEGTERELLDILDITLPKDSQESGKGSEED